MVPAPAEVHQHLLQHGQPPELAQALGDFYRACDAARFVPAGEDGSNLAAEAERLILAMEEGLCPLPPS
jgi:hypothetical protein